MFKDPISIQNSKEQKNELQKNYISIVFRRDVYDFFEFGGFGAGHDEER
jgi:hypothetical protein